jgi:phosphoglycolate phosphatase
MIRAVIFDLDGTILNTITTITHFVNETLQNHGISSITETECKAFIGDGARKLIERSLASKGVLTNGLLDKILPEYNAAYDEDPYHLTERYEGMPELLLELKESGLKLGVISNKPHPTTVSAAEHFYPNIFDAILGGREGVPLKPSVLAAETMMDRLCVKADEVIYVGDSGVDMTFGKAFGAAYTLGAGWGFRSEEELVSSGADSFFASVASMGAYIKDIIKYGKY